MIALKLYMIKALASRFGLDGVNGITVLKKGYTNTNYKLFHAGEPYILRLHREVDPLNLLYEADLNRFLTSHDIPVRQYLTTKQGNRFLKTVYGYISVQTFIDGESRL